MKAIKDKKGTHNGPYEGKIIRYGTKDERKERRKRFKAVRHKLKMRIPLTEEEEKLKIAHDIQEDTPMTSEGYLPYQ